MLVPHMSLRIIHRAFAVGTAFALLAPFLTACGTLSGFAPETNGSVAVSLPQVFTRERLVKERVLEQQWIESQRSAFRPSLQGIQDMRILEGFSARLQGGFNPLQGAVSDRTLGGQADAVRNKTVLDNLDFQLQRSQKEKALRDFQADGTTPPTAAGAGGGNTSPSPDPAVTSLKAENEELKRKLAAHDAAGAVRAPLGITSLAAQDLPDPKKAATTEVPVSSLDLFSDNKAYRDAINASLREKQLDDSHDLNGGTLYELKFDISMVPGNNSQKFALVLLEMQPLEDDAALPPARPEAGFGALPEVDKRRRDQDYAETAKRREAQRLGLYTRWLRAFRDELRDEMLRVQRKYLLRQMPVGELVAFRNALEDHDQSLVQFRQRLTDAIAAAEATPTAADLPRPGAMERDATLVIQQSLSVLGLLTSTRMREIKAPPTRAGPDFKTQIEAVTEARNLLEVSTVERKQLGTLLNDFTQALALSHDERKQTRVGATSGTYEEVVLKALAAGVQARYVVSLGRVVSFEQPVPVRIDKDTYFLGSVTEFPSRGSCEEPAESAIPRGSVPTVGPAAPGFWELIGIKVKSVFVGAPDPASDARRLLANESGKCLFLRSLKQVQAAPYVANIEPKELAQNISDVAARENMLSLMLGLQATLPQGVNLDAAAQYLRKSQTLLQALKRQPLAIGISDFGNTFGWILGPKFSIDGTRVAYLHAPVRQSFTVSVVVPAWAQALTLKPTCAWIGEDGGVSVGGTAGATGGCGGGAAKPMVVRLPANTSALTASLLGLHGDARRGPEMERDPNFPVRLQVGARDQKILILGRDLWRNPEVFLGSQRATAVEVLADMRGIVATFDKLDVAVPDGGRIPPADVRVVTSFGQDVFPAAVTMVAATPDEVRPFARLHSPYVDGGGPLRFKLDRGAMPSAYSALSVRVRPAGGFGSWAEITATPVEDMNELTTQLQLARPADWGPEATPYQLEADLRMKRTPRDDPRSVLGNDPRAFVVFKDATERTAKLQAAEITLTSDNGKIDGAGTDLAVVLPAHPNEILFKAHPGLKEALAKLSGVAVVLTADDKRIRFETQTGDRVVRVKSTDLVKKRAEGFGPAAVGAAPVVYNVRLEYLSTRTGTYESIPVDKQLTVSLIKRP